MFPKDIYHIISMLLRSLATLQHSYIKYLDVVDDR